MTRARDELDVREEPETELARFRRRRGEWAPDLSPQGRRHAFRRSARSRVHAELRAACAAGGRR